ncbi:MAG: hypothetical protein EOP89_07830 [Lysobacteraceae bacterium]|nr:MAG: hypothetical protein EOP89_07830 [Xanthomonadaceae bacterium]
MRILTDVDDTCLRFAEVFERYAIEQGWTTYGCLRDIYDLATFFGTDRETAVAYLHAFIRAIGHEQPAEACAGVVIPQLHAAGHTFVAVTACGLDPVFRLKRTRNLRHEFGFAFEDVHVVELRGDKTPILSEYEPCVWVEDHFGHALAGAELGHRTFLLDRAYNRGQDHPLVQRVPDWHAIAEALT